MENRDQRRWAIADEDDDGALNKIEFKHFLHPEEADHMRDIVVQVGVNFINIPRTAVMLADPKSAKNIVKSSVSFCAFGIYICA